MKYLLVLFAVALFAGCGYKEFDYANETKVIDSLTKVVVSLTLKSNKRDTMRTQTLKESWVVAWWRGANAVQQTPDKIMDRFREDSASFCLMVDKIFLSK